MSMHSRFIFSALVNAVMLTLRYDNAHEAKATEEPEIPRQVLLGLCLLEWLKLKVSG